MTDGLPDRLTQLRARWEADPASRIFLQLAEEYRHVGRVSEALTVLDAGLREHPGYLSALIARGRCLLELGQSETARDVLERVVKQDATQIVANKLLVRAYLETGQNDLARERLDLYTLLHDADPEIDDLRRRIQGNAPAPTATARAMEMTDDVFDLDRPIPPARRAVEDVFELSPPPAPPTPPAPLATAPVASVAPIAPGAPATAPAPAAAVAQAPEPDLLASPDDPFPELVSRDTRRRYLSALHSEGLFELGELGEAAPPEPGPWELAPEPAAPVAPTAGILEPEPAADLFELAPEPGQAPPPMPPMPAITEEPLWEPEPVWEPEVAEPAGSMPVFLPPVALEPAAPEPPIEEEEEWPEPAEPAERAARTLEPATVTLGQLYLRQGHLGEAERLFREVLEREPANAAARAGLTETMEAKEAAELAARQAAAPAISAASAASASTGVLDAGELLRSAGAFGDAAGGDVQARKVLVLKGYLDRIRRRSATRVS